MNLEIEAPRKISMFSIASILTGLLINFAFLVTRAASLENGMQNLAASFNELKRDVRELKETAPAHRLARLEHEIEILRDRK